VGAGTWGVKSKRGAEKAEKEQKKKKLNFNAKERSMHPSIRKAGLTRKGPQGGTKKKRNPSSRRDSITGENTGGENLAAGVL